MKRMKKIALVLGLAFALAGLGAGRVGMQELTPQSQEASKKNEYEGQHLVAKKGSFDITELEQLALVNGTSGEVVETTNPRNLT